MRAEIYWITGVPHGRLAIMPRPRGGDWLADELQSYKSVGVDVIVSLLTNDEMAELDLEEEPAICKDISLTYISHPVEDRGVPSSAEQVLALVDRLYGYLMNNYGVTIHCRMGIGRSSLLAACLLVKFGMRPDDVFFRISRDRGVEVPDTDIQVRWIMSMAEQLSMR